MADKKPFPTKAVLITAAATAFIWTGIGFSWVGVGFGWKTDGGANTMVTENAEATGKALYDSGMLTLACEANANADADKAAKLEKVSSATAYSRTREMTNTGWSSINGVTLSSSDQTKLANDCLELLTAET